MNVLDVDLYQFELVYRICFRKVVQKKEKGVELIVLTPCISVSYIKFLNISSLVPPDAYSNRAELHPESLFFVCKGTYLWGLCKFSALFFCVNRDISCDCFVNVLYIKILHCKITMKLFVFVSAELS